MLNFFKTTRLKTLLCVSELRTFDPIFNRHRFSKTHDHTRLGKAHSKVSFSFEG